jgi:hypothetical protein
MHAAAHEKLAASSILKTVVEVAGEEIRQATLVSLVGLPFARQSVTF